MRGKLKYIILIIAVLFLLIYFRYASLIKNILSPFFGGALLSYIAFPFVRMLTKKNVPKKLAIVFYYNYYSCVFLHNLGDFARRVRKFYFFIFQNA